MKDRKRITIAIVMLITILLVLYYILYFGIFITLLDGILKYILMLPPIIFVSVLIKTCIERIKEIKEDELDDISKY